MPLVNVSLLRVKSKKKKKALSDAIQAALVKAFKVPEDL
jgi:phenylpyruvate tautomerase PptA (4-oxalocrotonate tautomerase family)